MAFYIDEGIVAQAHMCEKEASCLHGKVETLCPVEKITVLEDRETVFVKCKTTEYCNFKISFRMSGHGCFCPVRKEIFLKSIPYLKGQRND